jgi:hypothetical protein
LALPAHFRKEIGFFPLLMLGKSKKICYTSGIKFMDRRPGHRNTAAFSDENLGPGDVVRKAQVNFLSRMNPIDFLSR